MQKRYNILIIEDNEIKLEKIKEFCQKTYSSFRVEDRNSYNSALQEVIMHGNKYDVILLDVSMYTYDVNQKENGGEPEPLAGANILRFMLLRKIVTPVIVVTMYESFVDGVKIAELDERFRKDYSSFYKGYVYYSLKNDDWKEQLKKYLDVCLEF